MSQSVRLGLIGFGRIAQMIHLKAMLRLNGAQVTAIAEPDPQRRTEAARLVPAAQTFESYHDLLKSDAVDAVVICLPTHLHSEAAIASFAAGKHVYVEKPLATSLDDARRVIESWKASGRVGTVGLNFRYHPLYRELKKRIEAGEIGNVVAVRTSFCAAPRTLPEWKQHRQTGGGVLLDLATHHVDLIRFIFGQEIREVSASARSLRSEADTASLHMRLADGTLVDTLVSMSASEDDRIEVIGDSGRLIADRFGAKSVQHFPVRRDHSHAGRVRAGIRAITDTPRRLLAGLFPPAEPSFALSLQGFVDAVQTRRTPAVTLEDGYRSLAVVNAAETSAAGAGCVTVAGCENASPPPRRPGTFDLTKMQTLQADVARAIADPALPAMSVVLVTSDTFASIRRVTRFLRNQTIAHRIELVLVGPTADCTNDLLPEETDIFHSVKAVGTGGRIENVDIAAATGVRASTAPVVTLVEDHAFPEPGYIEALLEAHRGPWAAVGCVVLNANPDTTISWANLLLAYGSWAEPVARGESKNISRHNIAYKRAVLEEFGDSLESFFGRDGGLLQILVKRGHRLFLETGARINHANPSLLSSTIELRFNGGRIYGATRARLENWSLWRRALYVVGGPLIPLFRARPLHHKVFKGGLFPRVYPALILGLMLDGIGQAMGYALGPGSTAERLARFEFNRKRHMTPGDQKLLQT